MSVKDPFPGARNDKSFARTDRAVGAVIYSSMYMNFRYPMYDHMGASHTMTCTTSALYMLWYACLLCVLSCLIATMFIALYVHVHGFCVTVATTCGGQSLLDTSTVGEMKPSGGVKGKGTHVVCSPSCAYVLQWSWY
jgi:hypothetical protein